MAKMLDNIGKLTSDEFRVSVAMGHHPGWSSFRKFGTNSAVTSGTEEMWPPGTIRVLPTSAGVVSVVSDSTDDDADPAGTGAWTVTVEGLSAAGLEISETVSLNGTSAVTTTASFYRINRMYNVTAGTGGINAGNISASIGGDLQAYIAAGRGQTAQTHYTVPSDHWVYVTHFALITGRMSGSTDLNILSQIKLAGDNTAWRGISNIYLWNGHEHRNTESVTGLPPGTEVRQQIISTASTQCVGIWGGYKIHTDYV